MSVIATLEDEGGARKPFSRFAAVFGGVRIMQSGSSSSSSSAFPPHFIGKEKVEGVREKYRNRIGVKG